MERRIGARAQVDFPVSAYVDGFRHLCRAVDLSPTGMLLERTRSLAARRVAVLNAFELVLPDDPLARIRMRARTVWADGRLQAVRFVGMDSVDRLTIAEQIDRLARDGTTMLH